VGRGQRTPGEHGSNLGVRNDAAPTSINSLVTGKGGDDGFTLIWSRRSADLIRQDRRLAFASGPELALSRCGFPPLPQVWTIRSLLKMPRVDNAESRRRRALRGRAAKILDGSTIGPAGS
jgi:hypothetical protein